MAVIVINDRPVWVPDIEVLSAFRCGYLTAKREGFPRTAEQVQGYIDQLELAANGGKVRIPPLVDVSEPHTG